MASTAALLIVLSVFNGMQDLVVNNFNRFNPPLKIEIKEGKTFSLDNTPFSISDLEETEGVKAVEKVISDLVLVTYYDKQTLTTVYGVSEKYPELSGLSKMTIDGNFYTDSENGVVLGVGVAALLGIDLNDFEPVKLYYPKRNKKNLSNPLEAFQMNYGRPLGVFASFTPYDENALFIPTTLAQKIMNYETECSYIPVYLKENISYRKIQKKIEQIVGKDFTVQNQMQQETLLFKTIKAENLMVYLILCFIFIIATFNIIGILGMLIIEKKQEISILHTLGASKSLLRKIFIMVGVMIGTVGGVTGMCIGWACCLFQKQFEIIKLGTPESSYIISAYPVSMRTQDFVVVFLLFVGISFLTSLLSLKGLKQNYLINKY